MKDYRFHLICHGRVIGTSITFQGCLRRIRDLRGAKYYYPLTRPAPIDVPIFIRERVSRVHDLWYNSLGMDIPDPGKPWSDAHAGDFSEGDRMDPITGGVI